MNRLCQAIQKKISLICDSGHCTCFPDTVFGIYIGDACRKHDRRYANARLSRYQADVLLFRCVKRKAGIVMATIMFSGVRIFGRIRYETKRKRIETRRDDV